MALASLLPMSVKSTLRSVLEQTAQFVNDVQIRSRILATKGKRLFAPAQIPQAAQGKVNLHLGCGKIDHKEFINIDGYPFPHVHYAQVIDKLPQFNDQSVDLIYASHCLEHFNYGDTHRVLAEWYRVLKKGAVLRISVPDFDRLLDIYRANHNDPDVILPQLMGGQNNKYNYHYTAFNELNLTRLLKAAGFQEVRLWRPNSGPLTSFPDFSVYKKEVAGNLYEVSLNIEATR
jgi:SAM-dependent methyltransferase